MAIFEQFLPIRLGSLISKDSLRSQTIANPNVEIRIFQLQTRSLC